MTNNAQCRTSSTDSQVPAGTLEDSMTQVADAAAEDAAARAAQGVRVKLDSSGNSFLADENRWQGYENGEARLFIAPGVTLYFREVGDGLGKEGKEFTLLSGGSEDDSVEITSLAQLHQHLTARAAGLPVATPVDGSRATDWDLSVA